MNKRERMLKAVNRHGKHLLAIFPNAVQQDPDKLTRALHRIEVQITRLNTDYCNGVIEEPEEPGVSDARYKAREKVCKLLGVSTDYPIIINRDPIGYALKIDDQKVMDDDLCIFRDFGGYGILSPEFTGEA